MAEKFELLTPGPLFIASPLIVEVPLFCTLIASYAPRKQKNIHFVKSPFRLSVTSSESMWILAHIEGTDFVGSKRGML